MWPRYETVVRPAFLRHAQAALDALQCGHGTRPWCVSCANLIRRSMVPLQCGHGTRPWCDRQSADAEDTDGDAAMWPRYETVVRRLSRPGTARDGSLQCGHGTRPWCDLTAPWLNDVDGNSCNVATVRDRGATRPGPARPAAPPRRCNVATVRDRGATSTNPAQSQNLQLQCGHGTRPWCDSVSARCGHTVWVAAMWPRYETVVRPADLWLCANEDQAAMWPRYETVVRPGQVGGPDARPQAAMWPRYETVVRLGIHPAQEDGRLAAMWPRYETVVRLPVVVAGITGSGKLQCGHGTRPWCDPGTGTSRGR